MTLPDEFSITIRGKLIESITRSNMSPGALGKLLEHALTGGNMSGVSLRSWGLTMQFEEHPYQPPE